MAAIGSRLFRRSNGRPRSLSAKVARDGSTVERVHGTAAPHGNRTFTRRPENWPHLVARSKPDISFAGCNDSGGQLGNVDSDLRAIQPRRQPVEHDLDVRADELVPFPARVVQDAAGTASVSSTLSRNN